MTHKLKGISILMCTLMVIHMSGVYDNNNAVINTLYAASTCEGVKLMRRIERRKLLLLWMSCCLF